MSLKAFLVGLNWVIEREWRSSGGFHSSGAQLLVRGGFLRWNPFKLITVMNNKVKNSKLSLYWFDSEGPTP